MREKLLHTPEGVRDIYNSECKKRLIVQDDIHRVLALYGYQDIETPSFEYFDIFNMDKGSAASNEMYKFFDRNNNTLVLRPDMTPSIARCVAKYYAEETLPIRLCYNGKTFLNAHQHQGKLSECTQIGGEFVNDDSSAADAEIIACVINCLLETGLCGFMIEIGEVDYFKGLMEEAGIDGDTEKKIRECILLKNFFGLSEFVSKLDISDKIKNAISQFDMLFGGLEVLGHAKELVTNQRSISAIDRMEKVYTALSYYGYDKYINFDFSMIHGYNYYTGIIFNGYTYGTGEPIVKGGRYNNLLSKFGKDAPSVGFAIYIDELMNAISRNKIAIETGYSNIMVLYDMDNQKKAIEYAAGLRKSGNKVELVRQSSKHSLEEYVEYAQRMHIAEVVKINDRDDSEITYVWRRA